MKTIARLLAAASAAATLAISPLVHAWGDHYTVTDRALSHPDLAYLDEAVQVEALETFLQADPQGLATLFADYYSWLKSQGSKRFKVQTFDPQKPEVAEFLKAARLHPKTFFPQIERLLPGDSSAYEKIAFEKVSPYVKELPPFVRNFKDVSGQTMKARAVLSTFADEPDWQMDHTLWEFSDYGYGEQPYGKPEGESSKAPFHTKFAHENFLVRTFASSIVEGGMPQDRTELFVRLSKFAFQHNHPYWGYRFAAWAMHYVQDLTQPYHSKAVPGKGIGYYLRYVVSFRKATIQRKTTQIEANRHFLYEDFVAFSLQQSYTTQDEIPKTLAGFLSGDGKGFDKVSSAQDIVSQVTEFAADHARTLDRTIRKSYPREKTRDPNYDLETDKDYKAADTIAQIPKESGEKLLSETGKDFAMTGKATRSILVLVKP